MGLFLLLAQVLFSAGNVPIVGASGQPPEQITAKISGLLASQVSMKLQIIDSGAISAAKGEKAEDLVGILETTGIAELNLLRQKIFIYLGTIPDASQLAELKSLGVIINEDSWVPPVGIHPNGFLTADVPVNMVSILAEKNYITALDTAERSNEAHNDLGTEAANVLNLRNTYGLDGSGVTIAVLDSGIDLTHPDFAGAVTASKDYSNYPTLDDTVANTVSGHGTHVAGSVLGRGSASDGVYSGSAPGANLVFLKIGSDSTSSASSAAIVNAIIDAVDVYNADIISMSYGGWSDHHDGTDAMSQAVDYAVSQGTVVFISAGNEAGSREHYSGTVAGNNETSFIPINLTATSTNLYYNLVWYDGIGTSNDLELKYYNSSQSLLATTNYTQEESPRGTESEYSQANDVISGTNYLKVVNHSASTQFFHLYLAYVSSGYATFSNPDPSYTLGSPAEADGAIAVGAYTTRVTWWDYNNNVYSFSSGETLDQIATFSSQGPRVDSGAPLKPEIVAPGSAIVSARDSDYYLTANTRWISNNGPNENDSVRNNGNTGNADYLINQGTSMAAPIAAGAAALILQAHPEWTPAQVRAYLESNAVDMGTAGDDSIYGNGRIYLPSSLAEPEMNVQGNGATITDGDTTPSSADHTDFGSIAATGGTVVRTFTIENIGYANLTLDGAPKVVIGGTHQTDFTVSVQPDSPVGAEDTTTFHVTFNPSAGGVRTATISIDNNDGNENPYNFDIQGTGVTSSVIVTYPDGGETWSLGSDYAITWSTLGILGNVKIEISRDNGATWEDIVADTANDGTHNWTVSGTTTSQALIRISAIADSTVNDLSDGVFAISGIPAVTDDPDNQTITYGNDAVFSTAASGDPSPTIQWQVSTDSGDNWADIAGETSSSLTVVKPPVSLSGNLYHAVFTNTSGTDTSAAATLTVNPKTLTVSDVTADDKTYDGDPDTTLTTTGYSFGGVESGDTVTLDDSGYSAVFNDKNVGTDKPVTVSGLALSGSESSNYALIQPTTLTADITDLDLTITAVADDKTYDGDKTASVTLSSDKISDDTISISFNSASFDNKNVGTIKTVTVSGISISGDDAANYNLTSTSATDTADITALAITVTAVTDAKNYDGDTTSEKIPTITAGSLASGDTVAWSQSFDTKHVGTGKTITPAGTVSDGNSGNNYDVSFVNNTTGVITALAITVTAATDSKNYDGDTTSEEVPTITAGSLANGDTVTWSQSFDDKSIGTDKTITPTGTVSDGNSGNNYDVSFVNNTGVITTKPLTVTGIIATDKVYDGDTIAILNTESAELVGVVGTEDVTLDISGAIGTFETSGIGNGKTVIISGLIITGNDIGNYSLVQPQTTANITPLLIETNLELTSGWNFISLPGTPVSTDIDVVLAGIIDEVVVVWAYQGAEWSYYVPGISSSTLSQMISGVGYWVNLSGDATLTISGAFLTTSDITLEAGWNLVGLTSSPSSPAINDILQDIISDVVIVWNYNSTTDTWTYFVPGIGSSSLTQMTQGNAYWLNVETPQTLTID
ncbi:MAG: YDG domain-containing protein [Dehalogenimonas sp.]